MKTRDGIRHLSRFGVLLLTVVLSPLASAGAATIEVGPGKAFANPSAGIAAAHPGDTVLIAPGTYFDCSIVRQNNLTIAGSGSDATAVLTDKTCGGKGILVVDANNVTVRNLTLTRARVPDNNGAGIRAEGTNLTVDGVSFINNQDGILANPSPDSTIIIRNSTFDRNGVCNPDCAHGIYISHVKLLQVVNSTFTDTRQGHHIKTRALRTEIIGCHISDGPEGTASYEIEVSNGGSLLIRDNTIEKGPKAENHTSAVMIGAEGVSQPTPEIEIANNKFRNDGAYTTVFVYNLTATPAILKGNQLSGHVTPLHGDGKVE